MAALEDIRLSANAYFYKLRNDAPLGDKEIGRMMNEVTSGKQKNLLFNLKRQAGPDETRYSFRVFKNKPSTPSFIQVEERGWKEQKIGYYLFIEYENYVAILKKYASVPKNIADKLEEIDYNRLLSLYANDTTTFKKMSLQNLDGSDHAMRNKTYESLNLSENVPTVGASRYYVRTVKGSNDGNKFSLTLYSSRVNRFRSDLTITQICRWVKETIDLIKNDDQPTLNPFLSIFAKPENYAAKYKELVPRSILIFYNLFVWLKDECNASFNKDGKNIDDAVFDRYINSMAKAFTSINSRQEGNPTKTHYYCGVNDAIEIVLNKSCIKLKNKVWDKISVTDTPDGKYDDTLTNLINRYSQFNVYFDDTELVYSNKKLFRDTRLISGISQFLRVLNPIAELEDLDCEKHTQRNQNTEGLNEWGKKSVFKVVEDCIIPEHGYDYVICDDFNDEWADHIAIGYDVVAFFVSKHKKSQNSASDFQDVVGQALKNLGNMNPSEAQLTRKQASWEGNYLRSNMPRLRSNQGTVEEALRLWSTNVMSPNFRREMCLVVDFLSADLFQSQLETIAGGGHPRHEASIFQCLWLLSSFVNGCLEYGVIPKIYCKP